MDQCSCFMPDGQQITVHASCDSVLGYRRPSPIVDASVVVRRAVATLPLPEGTPVIAPDPADNEWDMLAVGLPIWFTTTAPATTTTQTTREGIPISITATRGQTVFDTGETEVSGHTLTCTHFTPRSPNEPADAVSPDCGWTYTHTGTYTITATTTWNVSWSAAGQTGTLTTTRTSTAPPLVVGELRAVILPPTNPPR
jgi:hypothetical protein